MARNTATRFPLLPEVISGETADVYFLRASEVLAQTGRDPHVGMDVFSRLGGVFCGVREVLQLLTDAGFEGEIWALEEGTDLGPRESALQIRAKYSMFGVYETAILGILASETGWATAARTVVQAAGGIPIVSFGARHLHPNVSSTMDYAAVVGGCEACSTPLGSALAGTPPSGTMPHAFTLIEGDTVRAAQDFNRFMPEDVPRIVLVDTFQDETVESLRVARALGTALQGVRLDTPSERGGVTPALVREVRVRLDLEGFSHVKITVSGGMTPERIQTFVETETPVDAFGVGSFIAGARAIDFTGDIREIEGQPVAKRGRLPGMRKNDRVVRML
jgi:nicotinate phosphoribosyltransferase